jgi:hypothetical protein
LRHSHSLDHVLQVGHKTSPHHLPHHPSTPSIASYQEIQKPLRQLGNVARRSIPAVLLHLRHLVLDSPLGQAQVRAQVQAQARDKDKVKVKARLVDPQAGMKAVISQMDQ